MERYTTVQLAFVGALAAFVYCLQYTNGEAGPVSTPTRTHIINITITNDSHTSAAKNMPHIASSVTQRPTVAQRNRTAMAALPTSFPRMASNDSSPRFDPFPPKRGVALDVLDESSSWGVQGASSSKKKAKGRTPQWPNTTDFPMLGGQQLAKCFSGKRVFTVGHSHLQRIMQEWLSGMRLSCDWGGHCFIKGKDFTLRRLYAPAVFLNEMPENRHTITYREAILKASESKRDAMRQDIIIVARSMWDLVWYNTHPKDFAESYFEALKELLSIHLKKEGGVLVIHPVHFCRTQNDWRECYPKHRVAVNRLATFSAIRRLEKELGVKVTSMDRVSSSAQNIVLFDAYEYTKSLSADGYSEDGQHLATHQEQVLAEALLRYVFQCGNDVPIGNLNVSVVLQSSFPEEIPRDSLKSIDEFDRKSKAEISHVGGEKCGCLSSALGAAGIHPACRGLVHLTQKRRYYWVEKYMREPLVGASELQMGELLTLLCEKPDDDSLHPYKNPALAIAQCLDSMGTSPKMPGNLSLSLPPPPQEPFWRGSKCICRDSATTVQGIAEPRCADVAKQWKKARKHCKYVARFR